MSGEIIQMSSKQNMIFEPKDLEQASPATVSRFGEGLKKKVSQIEILSYFRCGMIYLDTAILGTKSLIKAWLKNEVPTFLDKSQKQKIELLAMWLIEPCAEFVTKNCEQFLFCSKMHLTVNFLKFYSIMLEELR